MEENHQLLKEAFKGFIFIFLFIVWGVKMCTDREVNAIKSHENLLKSEIHGVITWKQMINKDSRTRCWITWHDFQKKEYKTLDGCSQLFEAVEVGDTIEKGANQMTFMVKNAPKHPNLEVFIK